MLLDNIHLQLKQLITDASAIKLLDESHKHRHHRQHIPGKHHIKIIIHSTTMANLPMLKAHRLIYNAINEEQWAMIHAVAIEITPSTSL